MSEKGDFKYYVLRTITGKEKDVEEYIERLRDVEPVLRENVREILIPMETVYQVNKSAKQGRVKRTRPYYSGYVFVETTLAGETKHLLRRIPNVLGFLTEGEDLTPLPDAEVTRMKNLADQLGDSVEDTLLSFEVGERVKITFGPFNGFYGDVIEVLNERKKLKLLVKVFGRETQMEVDFVQVEKESMP